MTDAQLEGLLDANGYELVEIVDVTSATGAAEILSRAAEIGQNIQARAELYGITREQAADELRGRRQATGVIRDR